MGRSATRTTKVAAPAPPAILEPSPNQRRIVAALAAALCVVTLATFARLAWFDFVNYDDPNYLELVPQVRQGLTPATVKWAFTSEHHCNWHPLTTLTYLAESSLFGLRSAAPFHVSNVLLHAAASVALLLVLASLTSAPWRSALVAASFALHPLHVESVAWVSERKDVLSALLMFLTIGAYAAYARRGGARRYVLVLALLALGLMSKPMLVTLPFVLLLLDVWPLRRQARWRTLLIEKLPMFAMVVASSIVTYLVQRECGAMATAAQSPLGPRLANALVSYILYIRKTIWPSGLTVFYPYTHELNKPPLIYWPLALVLLLIATTAVLCFGRRRPYLAVGWLWFIGMLVPVIGIIQVGEQAMAERYTYLPIIGLFIIVAWGVPELLRRWELRVATLATGAAIVLIACTAASAWQIGYWKESETLFARGLQVAPNNAIFRFYYGEALRKKGMLDGAMEQYQRALELNPLYVDAWCNLGIVLTGKGEIGRALPAMQQAVELVEKEREEDRRRHLHMPPQLMRRHAAVYHNLGLLYLKIDDLPKAEQAMARSLEIDRSDPEAHTSLALAQIKSGKQAEAEAHLREALRLDPEHAPAHTQFGHLRMAQNRPLDAVEEFRTALRLRASERDADFQLGVALWQAGRAAEAVQHFRAYSARYPDDPRPYFQIGVMAQTSGDKESAIAAYRQAIERDPGSAALNNLAWMLATDPDPRYRNGLEAVRLAETLIVRRGRIPTALDTLAAAYAETGDFERAVKAAEAGIRAAEVSEPKLAADIRARLELYRQHKPYRETHE